MFKPQSIVQYLRMLYPSHSRLSLKRQLLLWVMLPQLVLWLVAGVLSYRMALNYAEKAIDQSLSQSVRALARQIKPIGSGLLIDFPRAAQDILEQDPNDKLSYMVSAPPGKFVIGSRFLPAPPELLSQSSHEPVLYDAQIDGKPLRVASMELAYGDSDAPQNMRVQVAQSLAVRERIAAELVRDMLLPLVLLGLLVGFLVYFGVRRGLGPLHKLQALLGDKVEHNVSTLMPLEMTQAPQEVRSLVRTLNQLLAAVRRSLHQEKRFVSDAAHQLRTPLAGLISQTQLAIQENDPQALRQRLYKVKTAAQRSAHLVGQLLLLARSEAEMEKSSLDLSHLLRQAAKDWTPAAINAGIDLGYESNVEAHMATISGNSLLLREAINNLLDNALRYAGKDAIVTIKLTSAQDGLLVEVEDNGPGIHVENLEQVFERFWRESQASDGCGLGLSIVAEIMRQHLGSAQAYVAKPHGFGVRLFFPHQLATTLLTTK